MRLVNLVSLVLAGATSGLTGCAALTGWLTPAPVSPWAPNPSCGSVQLAAYRTLATTPVGALEVTVRDVGGGPVASASIQAWRQVPVAPGSTARSAQCIVAPGFGITGADGKARLERLMTGPYVILVEQEGYSTASVTVLEGALATASVQAFR